MGFDRKPQTVKRLVKNQPSETSVLLARADRVQRLRNKIAHQSPRIDTGVVQFNDEALTPAQFEAEIKAARELPLELLDGLLAKSSTGAVAGALATSKTWLDKAVSRQGTTRRLRPSHDLRWPRLDFSPTARPSARSAHGRQPGRALLVTSVRRGIRTVRCRWSRGTERGGCVRRSVLFRPH
jgi:hypothetical protein